jgi:hypothetical protein
VVAVTVASSAGTGIAMALGGIVAVLVICGVFYAVGRGEDRERAQAQAQRDVPPATEPGTEPASTPRGPRRPRSPSSVRGRRRR